MCPSAGRAGSWAAEGGEGVQQNKKIATTADWADLAGKSGVRPIQGHARPPIVAAPGTEGTVLRRELLRRHRAIGFDSHFVVRARVLPASGAEEQGATDGFSILTGRDSRVRGGNHCGGLRLAGGDGVVTRAELQRPRRRRATA